jgi:hypothetical protein
MRRHIVRAALSFMLLGAVLTGAGNAQASSESLEYRIKAAFVCKFASYVEWPAQVFARADSPIVIGVIATESVADEVIRTAVGLSVEGRALVVRRLHRGDPVANAHIVYIASSEEDRLPEVLAAVKSRPVLVVTESGPAAALGSMINFVVVDEKVRFDITPQAAESSRLKISARLLSVARTLIGKAS